MIVVKVGGSEGIDLEAFCRDLANCIKSGVDIVLVHGGSHDTNVLSAKLGKPPRFVTSLSGVESRYTDRETLAIFTMVYVGKVNKYIVEQLQKQGVNAVGLSGIDGRLLEGSRKEFIKVVEDGKRKVLRDDYTGKVEKVNVHLVKLLRDNGYTPVITPPAISYESEAINVDGDRAAAVLAAALGAEKLIILSNVPGLLRDVNDASSLVTEIRRDQIERYADFAKGRMKKKVMGAAEALAEGVREVVFADARGENAVSRALEGKGTVIR
ncbi:MAG: [LysW]-aminoadipate kinase [Chloroflexi bacterium]|nr:[LysW]-aminoadipate kinase [Chloroflexota bacterium]MCL5108313.1 [LysW]-aminoadipate kinase [Chloroflexota bacterium]MDA8218269.1 [LysW]-aminoadipate kinase [Dehalococcoidales bacterium]